jgi:protein-disulfide isomerase
MSGMVDKHGTETSASGTTDVVGAEARDGSARMRAAAVRQAQAAAERRRRQFLIAGAVALIVVALVGVGMLVQHDKARSDAALGTGPLVAPAGAVAGGLGIPYGGAAAKVTLTVYEDYRCPYCKLAESLFESTYKAYAAAGKITVQYHLVDLIDRNLGGTGSLRAGNAGACAQDAGKYEAYHDVLYANQPDENEDAFGSNAALVSLAKQVPGLDTAAFEACVNGDTHGSWVKKNYDSLSKLLNGSVATPYYAIGGTQFKLTAQSNAVQVAAFKSALDTAVAAAG